MRSRGRQNREDRQIVQARAVAELYVHAGLSAAEAGRLLQVPRGLVLRTAHDLGLPVRVGGPPTRHGPTEIELVDYVDCGLGTRPIELPSGQPAQTVRALLRRPGVRLRVAGGRSPFLRRWRGAPPCAWASGPPGVTLGVTGDGAHPEKPRVTC